MNDKKLSSRQQRTLEAEFARPTQANIAWSSIENLLTALDADLISKGGSDVTIKVGGNVATFHRPHPQKEVKKWAVKKVREFLSEAGVEP